MDSVSEQLQGLLAIMIAGALAAVPGLDREKRHRPAGLRTHMIVAMSSALVTATARLKFDDDSAARITAGILTGIGFLGAGVILQHQHIVHDVTTAASIWMVAILGIVVGYELYVLATGATLILGFVLTVLRLFESKPPNPALKKPQEEPPPNS